MDIDRLRASNHQGDPNEFPLKVVESAEDLLEAVHIKPLQVGSGGSGPFHIHTDYMYLYVTYSILQNPLNKSN